MPLNIVVLLGILLVAGLAGAATACSDALLGSDVRIAHVTDIHWQTAPSLGELLDFKRALGSANLYLAGRRHHFPRTVQNALIRHLIALQPDLVLVTGDLTATALPDEFETARAELTPVLIASPPS